MSRARAGLGDVLKLQRERPAYMDDVQLEIDVAPAQGAQLPQAKASERGGDEHRPVLLVLDAPGGQLGVGQFALGRLVVASKRRDDRERVNFLGAEHTNSPERRTGWRSTPSAGLTVRHGKVQRAELAS